MQIKLGDKVRILQHRNYFGDNIPHEECPTGMVITVSEWDDINDDGKRGDWRAFTSVDVYNTWFRTDDVELVSDGPVRTERRIVPGVYGRLSVQADTKGYVSIALTSAIDGSYERSHERSLSAEELDSLAMVASQLAEALRDVD